MCEDGSGGEGLGIKNEAVSDGHNCGMMCNDGLDLPIISFC